MSNIVEADYTVEYARTLPVIIGEIKIIEQNTARIVLENGIQIGERLIEAKEQVGHGGFGQWCKENLNYSQDTAQKFMKLAKEYGDDSSFFANTATSRNFSISNALSLLKLPEEDREKFVEEHPVEDMTNKALEEEIRKLKEATQTADDQFKRAITQIEEREAEIRDRDAEIESLKQQLSVASTEPQVDQKEVMELERRLMEAEDKYQAAKADREKAEAKAKKAKEELKKEKDGRRAAIDQAIGNQRQAMEQEIRKEVEVELVDARKHIGELTGQIDQLEKRAANAGDEKKVQFKLLVDQLQQTFRSALDVVSQQTDDEMQDKMNNALRIVVKSFEEVL